MTWKWFRVPLSALIASVLAIGCGGGSNEPAKVPTETIPLPKNGPSAAGAGGPAKPAKDNKTPPKRGVTAD